MKRIALIAAAVALAILVTASTGSADIKVTPQGNLVTPTDAQMAEVFNFLLREYPPPEAQLMLAQVIWVGPKNAGKLVITESEDRPGEILPCPAICIVGGVVSTIDAELVSGDGSIEPAPALVLQTSFGSLLEFSGTASVFDPMTIHYNLAF